MPDEDSTLVSQSQQASSNQTGDDNDFVLDFGDGEIMNEVNDLEEKSDMNFDINTESENNQDSGDIEINQDELFGENQGKENKNDDLGNVLVDTEKNDKENDKENDDFFMDMSLNNEENTNQDVAIEGGDKLESQQTQESFMESQEGNVEDNPDFLLEMDGNEVSTTEENKTASVKENDTLEETEVSISGEDKQSEENFDKVVENNEENNEENIGNEVSRELEDQDFAVEEPLDYGQNLNDKQSEDNKFGISFDSNYSNESQQESTLEEDSNSSGEINIEDGNDVHAENNEIEMEENTDNISFDFVDDKNNLNQEEIKNDTQNDGNLSQNLDIDSTNEDNNLFGNNSQNESNEPINNVSSETEGNAIPNGGLSEIKEENILDQDSIQDNLNEGINQNEGGVLLDNSNNQFGENEIKNMNEIDKNQESLESTDSVNTEVAQPDMMNLLGGQSVDFSYEENVASIEQSENKFDSYQEASNNIQTHLVENINNNEVSPINNLVKNPEDPEKINLSTTNDTENIGVPNLLQSGNMGNLGQNVTNSINNVNIIESQNQTVGEISQGGEINEIPQVGENIQNQVEIGSIKSTLSLDEILDSELQSNPQFADNSKSVPKNIKTKSGFLGGKKMTIFAGIGVFLLFCIVVALAFPSISSERKMGDVVNTGTIAENSEIVIEDQGNDDIKDPTEYISTDENPQISDQLGENDEYEKIKNSHGSGPALEIINDEPTEDVKPYIVEEPEKEPEPQIVEEVKKISIGDIQSKISSFKTQGEGYKKVGENESNEKVTKYAAYVVRLCDEYQAQIDNGEGIDEETFSSFETKVSGFISKIEKNLNGGDEVSTIYNKVDYNEDDNKKELRAYLEENR